MDQGLVNVKTILNYNSKEIEKLGAKEYEPDEKFLEYYFGSADDKLIISMLVKAHKLDLLLNWNTHNWNRCEIVSEIQNLLSVNLLSEIQREFLLDFLERLPKCKKMNGRFVLIRDRDVVVIHHLGNQVRIFGLPKEQVDLTC